MVSGYGAAVMGGREVVGGGEVDPLAGIPHRLRFELHWTDKVLRPDLYQDVARTMPVTSAFEQLATMGPADAELVPEQDDTDKQGIILLESDDSPYADLDGADDWYSLASFAGPVTYSVILKPNPWTGYWAPVESAVTSGSNDYNWGALNAFGTDWVFSPTAVRKNGVDLVAPFNIAPISQWAVWTVETATVDAAIRGLFQLRQTWFGPVGTKGLFIHVGSPSIAHRDAVEAFYMSLLPT